MRIRLLLFGLLLAVSVVAVATEISGFLDKHAVRSFTQDRIASWLDDPTNATGCASSDCCPDTRANDPCTAAGVPAACCTGAGTGTCNDDACRAFAAVLRAGAASYVDKIEAQYSSDPSFTCSTFPDEYNGSRLETVCTVMPGNGLDDVARICSEIAGQLFSPAN